MSDRIEQLRRDRVAEINGDPKCRETLEATYGYE